MLTFVSRQVPFSITGFCMEPAADLNFNQLPQSIGVTVIKKKKGRKYLGRKWTEKRKITGEKKFCQVLLRA